ncbi:MAG: apolipoprotein N-acyltransferase [Rhizobiales bacterium]|nr:apolipoprotein N-acyltransferase [Hyphomicrobiales bacterium]
MPALTLARLAHVTVLAFGWRRGAIAFAGGAVSVLTLAPFDLWPIGFLTFPFLVWLIDGAAAGRFGGVAAAGIVGWWFGFGYFLAGLYWIGNAVLVDASTFGWLLPFAILLPPAGLALFTALGAMIARLLWTRGATRVLALAIGLTASEWLRGWLLTGFPWNAFGYALTGPLVLAQSAAILGVWGLTFLAVVMFASPAVISDDRAEIRRPWLPMAASLVVLIGMAGFGFARLAATPTTFVDGVRLRIMQPNLPQDVKFNYAAKQQVLDRYIALSDGATGPQSAGIRDITHLIWPESAFPFFLTREPDALAQIAALLRPGTVLVTGAVRAPATAAPGPVTRAYNSIYVIDGSGTILSVYDKVHLVPFGEYLPFQSRLERLGLMQLTKVQGGFISGNRRRTIEIPGAPHMLPLVCYEIIFPDEAVPAGKRPGWLVNLTNDGWFGNSSGPYQHLRQARVRAIEQGLPLVRAANTGISAIVDPLGRIVRALPLGQEGLVDGGLPHRLEPTAYVRVGDGFAGFLVGAALILVVRRRLRKR